MSRAGTLELIDSGVIVADHGVCIGLALERDGELLHGVASLDGAPFQGPGLNLGANLLYITMSPVPGSAMPLMVT